MTCPGVIRRSGCGVRVGSAADGQELEASAAALIAMAARARTPTWWSLTPCLILAGGGQKSKRGS